MKRLNLRKNWKRLGVQAGLLAGIGIAFMGPTEQPATAANNDCLQEDMCSFRKPILNFLVDYSTSMNEIFDQQNNQTRWQTAVDTLQAAITADNGFLSQNLYLGLMRFGHDPSPGQMGTPIPGDNSGIIDGQAVDVLWWDDNDPNKEYLDCNGQALIDSLENTPAPLDGNLQGIGTWTNGALIRSRDLMIQSMQDHPMDAPNMDDRWYGNLLVTDGRWTNPNGVGNDAQHDPEITAGDMFNNGIGPFNPATTVQTYVVYIGPGGDQGETEANQVAVAGGTNAAILAQDPLQLVMAVQAVVQQIKDNVVAPNCIGGLPRIMIILDASSSMLNFNGGTEPAPKGMSGWDQARAALAGQMSIFDVQIEDDMMMPTGQVVADLVHLGLIVFGHNAPAPGEQKVLVDYGPCMKDNFNWALAPEISHPGCPEPDYTPLLNNMQYMIPDCDLPWMGSPIAWQFESIVGGSPDPNDNPAGPGFDADTYTHMPKCDSPGMGNICSGSGTYTHLGLQLAKNNQTAYHTAQLMNMNVNAMTQYLNILITDGQYNGYSTDAQVQAELQEMANNGILTYVIGFGDGVNTPQAQAQLNNMAMWGGSGMPFDADNQAQLEAALKTIIEGLTFDPCCNFNDCSFNPEPTTGEPDPTVSGCQDDEDCPENFECVIQMGNFFGNCEPIGDCVDDSDCDPGEVCDLDADPPQCVVPPCTDDSDCGADEVCEDGICVPAPCMSDDDCPGDLVCNDGECGPGVCPDVPCPEGEVCMDGVCVIPPGMCTDDSDCGAGEICDATGQCVPDGGTTDSDTGTSDSDTGTTDSTSDSDSGPTTSGGSDSDSGDTTAGSDTDTATGGATDDEGCGCAVDSDEDQNRGLLGTALLLGLGGLLRRRRR
ncbi:MAG: VWA domain-containing protein [Nannocystaceae bacterium]